jgi:hypothetical protein
MSVAYAKQTCGARALVDLDASEPAAYQIIKMI